MRKLTLAAALTLTVLATTACLSTTTVPLDLQPQPETRVYVLPFDQAVRNVIGDSYRSQNIDSVGHPWELWFFNTEDYAKIRYSLVSSLREGKFFKEVRAVNTDSKMRREGIYVRVFLKESGADDKGFDGVHAWLKGNAYIQDVDGKVLRERDIDVHEQTKFGSLSSIKADAMEEFVREVALLLDDK